MVRTLRRTGRSAFPVILAMTASCARDQPASDPPLRPLVYTESPSHQPVGTITGYEMWSGETDPTAYPDEPPVLRRTPEIDRVAPDQVDLSTPEALGRALFRALTEQDEALLDHLVMPAAEYARAARTSQDAAGEHVAEVSRETRAVLDVFRGEIPSEQRPGGLGSLLELDSVVVRSPRLVSGDLAPAGTPGEMVLGSEVVARLRDTSQRFRIRLPKVLVDPRGQWRLAEAPQIGGMLNLFVEMGFHLSPMLLEFGQYPVPLQTGNYWTYRVRVEPRIGGPGEPETTPGSESEGSGDGLALADGDLEGTRAEPQWPTFREEVVDRDDHDGYALVRVERRFSDPDRSVERETYLLTARRVYRCNRDCRRNRDDVSWLLAHLSRRTPELVFPLRPGMGWRTGGRESGQAEVHTRSSYEPAHVPSGRFEQTVCVTRSTSEGRESRYIQPGIGTVLIRLEGVTETTYTELVDYRIIP